MTPQGPAEPQVSAFTRSDVTALPTPDRCRYPGCDRPPGPGEPGGSKKKYCFQRTFPDQPIGPDNPVHNPKSAYTAKNKPPAAPSSKAAGSLAVLGGTSFDARRARLKDLYTVGVNELGTAIATLAHLVDEMRD